MTDGPWSEGWPKRWINVDDPEAASPFTMVVPLSDAERLLAAQRDTRKLLDESEDRCAEALRDAERLRGLLEGAKGAYDLKVIEAERLRGALEKIAEWKAEPLPYGEYDDSMLVEFAERTARAALSQPVSKGRQIRGPGAGGAAFRQPIQPVSNEEEK